jgi:acyl-CoA hydrolase
MGWIDIAGASASQRYARSPVVTVSIDYIHFIAPIKTGYSVIIHGAVTYVGNTSMEVEVLVDAENTTTGSIKRATTAYLTYVAIDEYGRPRRVPPYSPKTAEAKKDYREAIKRRERRLDWQT